MKKYIALLGTILITSVQAGLLGHGEFGKFYSYHNGTRDLCNMNLFSEEESVFNMEVTLVTDKGEKFFFKRARPLQMSSGLGISEGTLELGEKDRATYYLKYHVKDGKANYQLTKSTFFRGGIIVGSCYNMDLLNLMLSPTVRDHDYYYDENPYVEIEVVR